MFIHNYNIPSKIYNILFSIYIRLPFLFSKPSSTVIIGVSTANSRLLFLFSNNIVCYALIYYFIGTCFSIKLFTSGMCGTLDIDKFKADTRLLIAYQIVCYNAADDDDNDIKLHNLTISFVAPITSPETPPMFFLDMCVIKKQQSIPMINTCTIG
jgi:hypothetical protein